MIKFTKFFITFLLAIIVIQARAQTASTATTSSPYSRYGLGDLYSQALPQNIGMGGLGAAVNSQNGYWYYNINPVNPASYSTLRITVIDIGLYGSVLTLNQTGQLKQSNSNFRLNHVAFAFPVSKRSALSFGLQPYSQVGYNYKTTQKLSIDGTSKTADTSVNYIYSGNGGLTKAYIGYGFAIGHLSLGGNVSYIFGKTQNFSSTEIPGLFGTLNSTVENTYSTGGINYDYGAQYTIDLNTTKHIVLGYSASANTQLTSQYSYVVSQYTYDNSGNKNPALDTLMYTKNPKTKIQLPQINHFGLTFVNDGKYMVGAEYSNSNWSKLSIGGVNQGLQDSKTYNIGAQITPNINALNNYWATIDYRLGFIYDQSYIVVNDPSTNASTNIKSYAVTFGLGLPLRPSSDRNGFYKINFAAEIGKRGTLNNGLVKENYVNLHLGFTLNDAGWFKKYKLN